MGDLNDYTPTVYQRVWTSEYTSGFLCKCIKKIYPLPSAWLKLMTNITAIIFDRSPHRNSILIIYEYILIDFYPIGKRIGENQSSLQQICNITRVFKSLHLKSGR